MPKTLFFPFYGPGRRSDQRVVEIRLEFPPEELTDLPRMISGARHTLLSSGFLDAADNFFDELPPQDQLAWYSSLLARTALLFQRKSGHRVSFFSVLQEGKHNQYVALAEHEHSAVGMEAVKLACALFAGSLGSLQQAYAEFSRIAGKYALPVETEAVIKAATRLSIPWLQADREPLSQHFRTDQRIRPNGLLILGQGRASRLLDGTFCIDLAGDREKALLKNRDQRRMLLVQLGCPTRDSESAGISPGRPFHLLYINGQVTALEAVNDSVAKYPGIVHQSLKSMCRDISKELGSVALMLSVRAASISQALADTGGFVEDFDLAPDLGCLPTSANGQHELLAKAADDLVNCLFPDTTTARIPTIALTGTNGKTTTARMVSHIKQVDGQKPGLVCTDGIFINGREVGSKDASAFIGHTRILTSKNVDTAVMESHHRGLAIRGFAFQNCDVAVCLNVTEEHLEKGQIETVEEMARIKRSLLERARDAVVLYADDPNCMGMLGYLKANRVCLVSLSSSVEQLSGHVDKDRACYCVLETDGNDDLVVLYVNQERQPVMPVTDLPITFDGTAKFNLSNAMHAIAASYLSGTELTSIRSAMAVFRPGAEFTPARMNVSDELPFRIIMDFAHNPDGIKKIGEFVDQQVVKGRKLIAFSGSNSRSSMLNRKMAQAAAGHFDFYFCKRYPPGKSESRGSMAPFMRQVLVEEGVPRNHITTVGYGKDVIFEIFDACKPGDLLVLLVGHVERHTVPEYIREYSLL